MVKYPNEAYQPAMEVYKHIPDRLKEDANNILGKYRKFPEGNAPPYQMAMELLSLVPKEQQSSLEAIVESVRKIEKSVKEQTASTPSSITQKTWYAGLLGGVATVLGFTISPHIGAAALLATVLAMYADRQSQYKTA